MADVDGIEGVLATEIAPQRARATSGGKFIRETQCSRADILQERQVEGDPVTGDTSDGGDDPGLRRS